MARERGGWGQVTETEERGRNGARWAEMKIEGKEQGGGKWGTKKSQRWAGKRMEWRDREEERDKAEMGREADAESGRREIETDRETESEPQRREGGSTERQTKGTGKGKKAHSDTRSRKRPWQSSRESTEAGDISGSPQHPHLPGAVPSAHSSAVSLKPAELWPGPFLLVLQTRKLSDVAQRHPVARLGIRMKTPALPISSPLSSPLYLGFLSVPRLSQCCSHSRGTTSISPMQREVG